MPQRKLKHHHQHGAHRENLPKSNVYWRHAAAAGNVWAHRRAMSAALLGGAAETIINMWLEHFVRGGGSYRARRALK